VHVVLVSWNSARDLPRALASVPRGVPVTVVDNASKDGSAAIAEAAGARVVRLESNVGFGLASNLGALSADAETVLFLNPDAELVDGEACLAGLLRALDADPDLAAAAPRLVGDGQERFQLRRLPTLGAIAREAFLVNRLRPRNAGFRAERYLDVPRDEPFDVEQPAAAALLVKRSVFVELGGFDPVFRPAWYEDVDLCARLLEAGWRIRFVPEARVEHAGGAAMKSLPYRDFLPLFTRNLFFYLERHVSAGARLVARGIVLAGALLRLALLAVTKGDHEKGDAAAAYVRVARGLLGLGWRTAL
jgi:GT2 family glycosyltransferase